MNGWGHNVSFKKYEGRSIIRTGLGESNKDRLSGRRLPGSPADHKHAPDNNGNYENRDPSQECEQAPKRIGAWGGN